MSSTYTGNSVGVQSPASAPGYGVHPQIVLPADGDALNVSAILQAFKCLADYGDWLQVQLGGLRGIRPWSGTVVNNVGDLVQDPDDLQVYRCKTPAHTSGMNNPSNDNVNWEQWGFTIEQMPYTRVLTLGDQASNGITSVGGGSATSDVIEFVYGGEAGSRKAFEFTQTNVPSNGEVIVDFSGLTGARPLTIGLSTGVASMVSGSAAYGGQVGLRFNVDGNAKKIAIWYKAGVGNSTAFANVGLRLLGA